jgi:hypothetical protein
MLYPSELQPRPFIVIRPVISRMGEERNCQNELQSIHKMPEEYSLGEKREPGDRRHLPVCVMCSVEGRALGLGMHVENVFASPGRGIRIILDRLQIPFGASSHGIHGDAAQEADLAVGTGSYLNSFDERLQVRRVSFAAYFHADEIAVGVVFIAINGIVHLAQGLMKLRFFGPDNSHANDWQCSG